MDTSRSEQPAKRRRPTRRSMAEFAPLLESGAVVEKLTSRQAIINGQTNKAQGAAASVPQNKNLNYSGPEDDRTSQQLDEVTLAAAKSAKVNIAAAPDCAHGLTSANLPPGFADRASGRAREGEAGSDTLERQLPLATPPAEDYRAKAIELINANVNTTLDYAWRLGNVTSAAELIELSINHAHKHFQLIMKHAAAFTS